MADDLRCDVAIIGAGTAGLAAERTARRTRASTLLIDPTFSGTTCATVGCMPSKLLIAAARAAHGAREAGVFGLDVTLRVDGPAVMKRLREERDKFAQATRDEIAKLPANVRVSAVAHFVDGNTLALDDGRRVTAKAIVIATGSRPSIPKMFEPVCNFVLTNETVFELEDLTITLRAGKSRILDCPITRRSPEVVHVAGFTRIFFGRPRTRSPRGAWRPASAISAI